MSTHEIRKPVIIRPQAAILCESCEIEGDKQVIAGRIINGQLVYKERHHGKTHTVRIDLEYLKRLLAA